MSRKTDTSDNPYAALPDRAFWRRAVSRVPWITLDPVTGARPIIGPVTRVCSAGSCFAQHVARFLLARGLNYLRVEGGEGDMFSARYGNIYTVRQLLQLFQRATGVFVPDTTTSVWREREGERWLDAFRPTVAEPRKDVRQVLADRRTHMLAVRKMFEEMEIFIFTLGLTESWRSATDGAVFPVAPGVLNRGFDPGAFVFHNFTVREIIEDFGEFIGGLRRINPGVKIVLTVSPVPLIATYEPRHVLVANSYSKSALRAAAHEICEAFGDVFYFPSYEIFTGPQSAGRLYEEDLREVTVNGVNTAMALFLRHFAAIADDGKEAVFQDYLDDGVAILCDEDMLEKGEKR